MGEDDLAIVDVEDAGVRAYGELVFEPGRRVLSLGLADPAPLTPPSSTTAS